jgi:hypothetical protein
MTISYADVFEIISKALTDFEASEEDREEHAPYVFLNYLRDFVCRRAASGSVIEIDEFAALLEKNGLGRRWRCQRPCSRLARRPLGVRLEGHHRHAFWIENKAVVGLGFSASMNASSHPASRARNEVANSIHPRRHPGKVATSLALP